MKTNICPSCEVPENSIHLGSCTIGRCKEHGEQKLSCSQEGVHTSTIWKGVWPGTSEAIKLEWFAKYDDERGWISCDRDEVGAKPDLNRVAIELTWNSSTEEFE